jgi:hypothetical protein
MNNFVMVVYFCWILQKRVKELLLTAYDNSEIKKAAKATFK